MVSLKGSVYAFTSEGSTGGSWNAKFNFYDAFFDFSIPLKKIIIVSEGFPQSQNPYFCALVCFEMYKLNSCELKLFSTNKQ